MEGISVGIPRLNRAGIIIDIEEVAHPYHARSRRLWGGELDFLSGHAHFGAPSVRSIFNGELPVAVPGVTAVIGVFVKGIAGAVEGEMSVRTGVVGVGTGLKIFSSLEHNLQRFRIKEHGAVVRHIGDIIFLFTWNRESQISCVIFPVSDAYFNIFSIAVAAAVGEHKFGCARPFVLIEIAVYGNVVESRIHNYLFGLILSKSFQPVDSGFQLFIRQRLTGSVLSRLELAESLFEVVDFSGDIITPVEPPFHIGVQQSFSELIYRLYGLFAEYDFERSGV